MALLPIESTPLILNLYNYDGQIIILRKNEKYSYYRNIINLRKILHIQE